MNFLTSADIEQIRVTEKTLLMADAYESLQSMTRSQYASVVGIALALNEIRTEDTSTTLGSK